MRRRVSATVSIASGSPSTSVMTIGSGRKWRTRLQFAPPRNESDLRTSISFSQFCTMLAEVAVIILALTAGMRVRPSPLTRNLIVVALTSSVSSTMPEIRKRNWSRIRLEIPSSLAWITAPEPLPSISMVPLAKRSRSAARSAPFLSNSDTSKPAMAKPAMAPPAWPASWPSSWLSSCFSPWPSSWLSPWASP